MGRQWTPEQHKAIEARGGPLLVSAAAGSGKTSVLVERVIRQLTDPDNPIPADRFLIATFSNAAASEMRERIEASLSDLLRKNPQNTGLRRQKILLNRASISTVHSFCLQLVREHFHHLDISPDFRIGDTSELDLLKQQSIDEVIESWYESEDEDFLELVELLSGGRDDKQLVRTVFSFYEFICSHPFPDKWMDEKLEMYREDVSVEDSPWGQVLLEYADEALTYLRQICAQALELIREDEAMAKAYEASFSETLRLLEGMAAAVEREEWDELIRLLRGFAFPRLGSLRNYENDALKQQVTGIQKTIKDTVLKELRDKVFVADSLEYRQDVAFIRPKIRVLFSLVRDFTARFRENKRDRNMADFSDLEHLALELLVQLDEDGNPQKTELAREIGRRYDAVLVDEYQDTNEVQDLLFRTVSLEETNLFMVGDVKQSIYRFRQAMPEIFIRRRYSSVPYDGRTYPAYITLGKNFRSREAVCGGINDIFRQVISPAVGGVDYSGEEMLVPGATYPETDLPSTHIHVIDTSGDESSAYVQEARYIGEKITRMVEEGFPVTESGEFRPCTYRDFAILLRAKTHTAAFESELTACGIPVWSDFSKKFFTSKEVLYLLSFLQAVDNPLEEVSLCSAMMSPMFGFTSDEMAALRLRNREKFYLAVVDAAGEGNTHCQSFLRCLEEMRAFAVTATVDRIIQRSFDLTEFDLRIQAMRNGDQRMANLNLMVKQAKDYESAGYRGLSGFNRLMARMMEEGLDIQRDMSLPESENVVKIMTMHRSKGLEFPICFVADNSRRFNMTDLGASSLYHAQLGFSCKYRDLQTLKQYSTIPHEAIKLELRREALSEEMRVLYVAFTRAREHLFITVTEANPPKKLGELEGRLEQDKPVMPFVVRSGKNFSDWVLMASIHHASADGLRSACGLSPIARVQEPGMEILLETPPGEMEAVVETEQEFTASPDPEFYGELQRRCSFIYPEAHFSRQATKLAVSDMAKDSPTPGSVLLRRPKFMYSQGLSPAERGNAHHTFMQFADYSRAKANPKEEIARLLHLGYLRREEAEVIRITKLRSFFSSSLAKRIFASQKVLRELKFIVAAEGGSGTQRTMIQGVADCVFYEDGSLVIVDYKTDRVQSEEELAGRYRPQLEIYRQALEESLQAPVKELILYSFHLDQAIVL